jgi:hypothetical protein
MVVLLGAQLFRVHLADASAAPQEQLRAWGSQRPGVLNLLAGFSELAFVFTARE